MSACYGSCALLCFSQLFASIVLTLAGPQTEPRSRLKFVQQEESMLALRLISHPTGLRPVTVALASVSSSHPERVQLSGDTVQERHTKAHRVTSKYAIAEQDGVGTAEILNRNNSTAGCRKKTFQKDLPSFALDLLVCLDLV